MERRFFGLAALFGFFAVALGAFGAHGLRGRLSPADLAVYETGVRYQMYHALALFVVSWASSRRPSSALQAAGWLFSVGIVLFSGSLYALVLTGRAAWGFVTPFGGLAFLAAWGLLAWSALSRRHD